MLSEIIGNTLVQQDDEREPDINVLTSDAELTEDQHYYKVYSLLIPEMLNRAFENIATERKSKQNEDDSEM